MRLSCFSFKIQIKLLILHTYMCDFYAYFYEFLEAESHYVEKAGMGLVILLLQPHKCWHYRCGPLCLTGPAYSRTQGLCSLEHTY
jgi:hypothetical protein